MKVVVVGGGISGLTVAWFIARLAKKYGKKYHVTILEKHTTPGGVIRTSTWNNLIFEWGPDGFTSRSKIMLELIKELGLDDELIVSDSGDPSLYICYNNRLHPFPTALKWFLKSRLIPLKEKLILPYRIFGRLELPDSDFSAQQLFEKYLGKHLTSVFIKPLLEGLYGDISVVSARTTLPGLISKLNSNMSIFKLFIRYLLRGIIAKSYLSFKSGMQTLPLRITEQLENGQAEVYFNTCVHSIKMTDSGMISLETSSGKLLADKVVIATSPHEALRLVSTCFGHAALNEVRGKLEMRDVYIMNVALEVSELRSILRRFGNGFICGEENLPIRACTWISNKYPQREENGIIVARCFLSKPDVSVHAVVSFLEEVAGVKLKPVFWDSRALKDAMPTFRVGYAEATDALNRLLSVQIPQMILSGSVNGLIGIPRIVDDSYLKSRLAIS